MPPVAVLSTWLEYTFVGVERMINTTINNTKTTMYAPESDIIDQPLKFLQIAGSLLLRETYASPWAISLPRADELTAFLKRPSNALAIAFHLVEFGRCRIKTSDQDIELSTGEMAICFGGVDHTLYQGKANSPYPIEDLLAGGPNIQRPHSIPNSDNTSLLCGVFLVHDITLNPLFSALPNVLHTSLVRSGEMHNLSGVARLMTEEINRNSFGSNYMIERLLEILCAEAIRSYIETTPQQYPSWFRGIKDPVVGRAIAEMHSHPGADWSVKKLAEHVAMSPSRFAARFSESLGSSPMTYLTKWRMNIACQMLTTTKQRLDRIASDVGYENTTAFSRAFKKHIGLSPSEWRTSRGN